MPGAWVRSSASVVPTSRLRYRRIFGWNAIDAVKNSKIFAVNPELRNEPARSNRDEKLEGEVERPSQKAEKA